MPIEKLKECFEAEYHFTKTSMERGRADKNAIWYAIQRCLGASDLAQMMGASFADVEPMFEEIKHRLMELEV